MVARVSRRRSCGSGRWRGDWGTCGRKSEHWCQPRSARRRRPAGRRSADPRGGHAPRWSGGEQRDGSSLRGPLRGARSIRRGLRAPWKGRKQRSDAVTGSPEGEVTGLFGRMMLAMWTARWWSCWREALGQSHSEGRRDRLGYVGGEAERSGVGAGGRSHWPRWGAVGEASSEGC